MQALKKYVMNKANGEEREIKYIIVFVVSNLRLLFSLK